MNWYYDKWLCLTNPRINLAATFCTYESQCSSRACATRYSPDAAWICTALGCGAIATLSELEFLEFRNLLNWFL